MRLLLVEDDPRMRALVRRGLTEHGHVVEVASTGPEAVELAAAADFDVAVLDVMLPGFDGVEVVQRLRARANRTPVLMLTTPFDGVVVQAVDDGHLEIAHAVSVFQGQKRAVAMQRDDAHAGQPPEHGAIHHNQRSAVGNRDEGNIRQRIGLAWCTRGQFLQQ